MRKGLHVESRQYLSKASNLVEPIIRIEHPRTLACFLEVFIHFIQTGLPEISLIFRNYVTQMSENVTAEGHPWGKICQLFGLLDSQYIEHTLAHIWKCTTDTLDVELGKTSRLAVSVRLDYIKRVVTNNYEEERLLRDLLAQLRGVRTLPTPRVMLNLAHNLIKQGQHVKAEGLAVEI